MGNVSCNALRANGYSEFSSPIVYAPSVVGGSQYQAKSNPKPLESMWGLLAILSSRVRGWIR